MENDTDNTVHNRKGRPSKFEQLEIENRLKPLFMSGLRSYLAANETGYSINTVKKYFDKFCQEVRDSEGPEFMQACKDRKISTCLGIDKQILKMEKLQKELEQKPQTGGKEYIQLNKLRISVAKSISDLHIKKLNIANFPTSDEIVVSLRKVDAQK